jgi:hypothetical protein
MRKLFCALLSCLALALVGCGNYFSGNAVTGYTISATTKMKTIRVQKPLPGGQSTFELVVGERTFPLQAGKPFFFTGEYSDGVGAFMIRGINVSERLDPKNDRAFPVGISFMQQGITGDQVKMVPIVKKPSWLTSGWVLGPVAALTLGAAFTGGIVWWRRKDDA